MKELSITVKDVAGLGTLRPVTGGIPIAEGAAREGTAFVLCDDQGNTVPLQTSVFARWKDGSARWVLLDFQSKPPAGGRLSYTLSWGESLSYGEIIQPKETGVRVSQNSEKRPVLESSMVTASLADGALLRISNWLDVVFSLTDATGQVCDAVVETAEVETMGVLRSTLSLVGSFRTPEGKRVFQFRLSASVYAGLSMVRLEPLILIDADKDIIQRIRELKLMLRPRQSFQSARLGGDTGWKGPASSAVRLFQYDDEHYILQGAEGAGLKAPGWVELDGGHGPFAVAMRDFWQQWPKSIEASPQGISIGLFPRFQEGDYASMAPWYKHQYLFEGDCYRLRTGQARRWELWLDFDGDGQSLAQMTNAPLIPVADPSQAIATGVWDAIAPADTPDMAEYDQWAENLFHVYCRSIKVQREYGAMNWGVGMTA